MDQLGEIAQHLLRFSPDALIVVDERGRIRFVNETVAELFGYTPEQLLGASMETLIPERFRTRHTQHTSVYWRDPRSREMGARITDLFARKADGSEFPAGIRLAPFKLGEASFIAAAIRDMSERRRINDELVTAREEADRANRAKSRFLATASHDLRQPLQAIRLLNAAAQKLSAQPEMEQLLNRQEQAIDTMARLLNALLDISRLESGAVEPQRAPVALADVLDQLRSEFEPLARVRDLKLDVHVGGHVLMTDRILFYQLLQNLVGNAVKYTDAGRVAVVCSLNDDALVISIEDTGVGIPDDKVERIFDEYYQVDSQGGRRFGVGLGLAIVKEVARLLGYSVKVSSRLGKGTQVRVSIPRQMLASMALTPQPVKITATTPPPSTKSRLMLLEDNEAVRTATELFLNLEGYETMSTGSLAEAEPLFESLRPGDILIADYHLGGQSTGLDVLKSLRAKAGTDIPAIVLSGDLPAVLRAVKTPVPLCRFLSKPVDTSALIEAIGDLSRDAA